MQCPVCNLDMVIVEYREVELDLCIEGHGVWFDADELRQLFEVAGVPHRVHDLEGRLEILPRGGEHGPRRRCPRCGVRMDHVRAPGKPDPVILDRCGHGHGLWFDEGELAQILSVEMGEGDEAFVRIREFLGQFAATKGTDSDDLASEEPASESEAS